MCMAIQYYNATILLQMQYGRYSGLPAMVVSDIESRGSLESLARVFKEFYKCGGSKACEAEIPTPNEKANHKLPKLTVRQLKCYLG